MPNTRKRKIQDVPEDQDVPENEDVPEDIPEHIVKHRVNSKTLQAEFYTKWENYKSLFNTWEPAEHLFHRIDLLQDYEKKHKGVLKSALKACLPDADASDLPNFKVLDKEILSKFNDPEEFIPQGNETIRNISCEFPSEAGVPLWRVKFGNDVFPRPVRKAVMLYYWPVNSCMFLAKWVQKIQAFTRFEAEQNAGKDGDDPE